MKLYIKFLIIFLECFCIFTNVYALTDEEPPTLSNIYFSSYNLKPGDQVTIYVTGNDNLTGIGNIDVELRLKSDNSKYFTLASNVTPSNSFSYTKTIPENVTPGEYEIYVVQVWDAASNLNTYYIGGEGFPFSVTSVTINDSDKDYTAPKLSNIIISPQITNYPKNFSINADAIDDKSGIKEVSFLYSINGKIYQYNLAKSSGNTYTAKAYMDEDGAFSDANFITAYVYDNAGNVNKYDTDVNRDPYRNYKEIILSQNLDVKYTNKIVDNELPVLSNYSYSSSKVSVPGTVTMSFSITDDTGISQVKVYFQGYDENNKLINSLIIYADYNNSKKIASAKYTFSQYTANSTFYVEKVEIIDKAGKTAIYTIYENGNLKIEKKTLTLVQAITSDLTTSTVNNDYIEKINNLGEGQTITIDTTSNDVIYSDAFDAIKGIDKNIIVVNDGIQWIFNGNNIVNTTKNINTKINVYKIDEYGNKNFDDLFDVNTDAIVIEFANNGLLPGKALIKIKADYSLRNYLGSEELYVYHVQTTEDGLETIAKQLSVTDDGYYEFYITHNSKYIISKTAAKSSSILKDSTGDLGNDKLVDKEDVGKKDNISSKGTPYSNDKITSKNFIKYEVIILPIILFGTIFFILYKLYKRKKLIKDKIKEKL